MAAAQIGSKKGKADSRYVALLTVLKDARVKQGLSQADLATQLGQVQQFVSRYETGERRLDVVEFMDVARELGIDGIGLLKSLPLGRRS